MFFSLLRQTNVNGTALYGDLHNQNNPAHKQLNEKSLIVML